MFSKAIVWGCPLHAHTNSYVYAAFYKAFKSMGFDAYWLNEHSDVSGMDFSNTIFITEGQHDGNIPLRNDCKYVLHNCYSSKYNQINLENKLLLQTFTNDVFKYKAEKIADGSYYLKGSPPCLFQSWGTDLLPDEINLNWADLPRTNECHYIGSVCGGEFSNLQEIEGFKQACQADGVNFIIHHPGSCSFEENQTLIQRSIVAPALHGTWQAEKGYIACRIFKNISYGHLGVTNCEAAYDLLEQKVVFSTNVNALYCEAKKYRDDKVKIIEAMKLVRDKHTYVNRIRTILSII
jgi:hypothetical protein